MKTDLVVTGFIFDDDKLLLILHKKLQKWLPVGGHIDSDETPDKTVIREIKEETNLDIEFLEKPDVKETEDMIKVLPLPFFSNTHNVGSHDHCSLDYLVKAKNPDDIQIKKDEIIDYKWFTKEDLSNNDEITPNVKEIALYAFKRYKEIRN